MAKSPPEWEYLELVILAAVVVLTLIVSACVWIVA